MADLDSITNNNFIKQEVPNLPDNGNYGDSDWPALPLYRPWYERFILFFTLAFWILAFMAGWLAWENAGKILRLEKRNADLENMVYCSVKFSQDGITECVPYKNAINTILGEQQYF